MNYITLSLQDTIDVAD